MSVQPTITFAPLLPHGSAHPKPPERADQRTLLEHHSSVLPSPPTLWQAWNILAGRKKKPLNQEESRASPMQSHSLQISLKNMILQASSISSPEEFETQCLLPLRETITPVN